VGDSDVRSPLTKVSLAHDTKPLPKICVVCGRATDMTASFQRRLRNPRYSLRPAFFRGGVVALLITWLFDYLSGRMYRVIALRIPQCDVCMGERRELRVLHTDFETAVATFVVRREFKDALDSSNRFAA
jgi:hypothetical protein